MEESSRVHTTNTNKMPIYESWCQTAGYFDGDGTVEFSIRDSRVLIRLAFDDNWKPFLDGIRTFLLAKGVNPGSVRRKERTMTWHVVVSGIGSVIQMAKEMMPYAVKKRNELEVVVGYLEGRLTGKEFVKFMNDEVMQGQRTGKLRSDAPPFRRKKCGKRWRYVLD